MSEKISLDSSDGNKKNYLYGKLILLVCSHSLRKADKY